MNGAMAFIPAGNQLADQADDMCVAEYGVDVIIKACTSGIYETADSTDND